MSSPFDEALLRMDTQLFNTFGKPVTLALPNENKVVMATIEKELNISSGSSGFSNRYENRANGIMANRSQSGFLKSEVAGLDLDGVIMTLEDNTRYELNEVIDEDDGVITYGITKF